MREYTRWTLPLLNRARELHGAGLSYAAIAAVINLDKGTTLKGEAVKAALLRHGGITQRASRNTSLRRAA